MYISGVCTEYNLVPFKKIHYGAGATSRAFFENIVNRDMLRLVTAAGVLLLVFALLNYISLTTAQVGFRVKEMATRRLIGSSRGGVILRYIGESFVVTAVSFVLGFVLAEAAAPMFSALIGKNYSPLSSLTWGTAALWAGVIVLLSVIAGIVPALMVSRYRPIDIVRGEFTRASRMVLGRVFLVVQNTAAIGAVAIAIAMFLQLRHMVERPMGYTRDSLVDVTVSNTQDPDDFLKDRIKSLPCVADAGWVQGCPAGSRRAYWGLQIDGNRYNIVMYGGDTTALRLLEVKVLSQNSDPLPNTSYFTRRAYASEDRSLRLTSLFALLTIVLTVMAMVAMSTYYARQRAKSTAIRKIMGCPRLEIYTHTLASFLSASLIAAVIATPLIYTYTGRWLQTYSYRIDNHWWIYLLALLIVGVIAALSISYRAVQLMNTNPALALRKD